MLTLNDAQLYLPPASLLLVFLIATLYKADVKLQDQANDIKLDNSTPFNAKYIANCGIPCLLNKCKHFMSQLMMLSICCCSHQQYTRHFHSGKSLT